MRKALNENPIVQVAVVGLLIVIVGLVFMMNMGGGGGGGADTADTGADSTPAAPISGSDGGTPAATPTGSAAVPTATPVSVPLGPAPPADVRRAYNAGDTIVLLVYRPGGIEDRFVKSRVEALRGEAGVSIFLVPADEIARYSQLTQGLHVGRVPAMIVVSPKRLSGDQPYAQVHFGYLSRESVIQAVRDAEYEGQPASYGPE